jgi:RNA polymerase sigma-70 factor (ECF subfamily)
MSYRSLSCDELVRACAEGNAEAWEEFVRRFQPVISGAIWRIARRYGDNNSATIAELIQDTYLKICKDNFLVLRAFKAHHEDAFYGWLKVVTTRVALDHYRRRSLPVVDCELTEIEPFIRALHVSSSDHLEFRRLCQQVDYILCAHCTARDREIFWLYYGEMGLTAAEITKIRRFNLDESGVESVIQRLKSLVRRKLAEPDQDPAKAHVKGRFF